VNDVWPWLVLAGLGFFHGINPAMGWLFAVALGLHRKSERTVLLSLIPIALGHALSIAIVVAIVMAMGTIVDLSWVALVSGVILIGWALWHWLYGHRHRVYIGMQAGLVGLAIWSFLMASAHGAGLMLIPALLPLHAAHMHEHGLMVHTLPIALAAVAVHTGAMLLATGTIAILVYRWLGVAILKRTWINFDILWTAMLVLAGLLLIWTGLR
jgi:hypothetical protein